MNVTQQTKIIQEELLKIFIEIDKLCVKYNLRYFAIGGTCLGAVRHKGFIPWDDDLDIAMPRKDYEKFKEIAQNELPEHLQIFKELEGEHNICKFIKVHNRNTTFIEKCVKDYKDRYIGVFVDIMPLDGIPNNRIVRNYFLFVLRQLSRLDWNRKYHHVTQEKNDNFYKKIIYQIVYFFIKKIPSNYFSKIYLRLQKKYSYEKSEYLSYTWSPKAHKIIFPKKDFDDYILIQFENTNMRCPIGYDNFLKTLFGDYMQLPPVEQRKACHETEILDLYTPYSFYKEER